MVGSRWVAPTASAPQLLSAIREAAAVTNEMLRNRLLLLAALAVAVGFLVVLRLRTPTSTIAEQPPPPPPSLVEPREPALQSDAEGYYVPGYRFAVSRFRFTGFSLRPEALVTFAQASAATEYPASCFEARISADTVHLRCDYPQVGTVTIDGHFLTRLATERLDAPVLSAVVTVRAASGDTLYSARDSFVWHPGG